MQQTHCISTNTTDTEQITNCSYT